MKHSDDHHGQHSNCRGCGTNARALGTNPRGASPPDPPNLMLAALDRQMDLNRRRTTGRFECELCEDVGFIAPVPDRDPKTRQPLPLRECECVNARVREAMTGDR